MLLSRKFVSDYIDLPEELTIETIAEDMTNVGNEYENFKESLQTTKDLDVYEIPQEYRDEIVRIVTFHEWKKYERI